MLSSNKQVLYLTYDGLTDPLGQAQVIPYLEGLQKQEYCISIISFEKKGLDPLAERIGQGLKSQGINWHPIRYSKHPPIFSTVFDLWKMKRKAKKLHQELHFNIVHCRSYVPAVVGLSLKRKKGIKFLFDIRGFWVEERVEGGIWNLANPAFKLVYKYFKSKEKQFFNESDAVISLTEAAKNEIESKFNVRENVIVIPCCVDMVLFDPKTITTEDQASLKKELGIEDELVIVYLGSLGTWYDLDLMLKYFTFLKNRRRVKFMLLSKSPKKLLSDHRDYATFQNDCIFLGLEREELPRYLAIADLGVFFYKKGYSRIACSPTKLGEMMAMNLPVVGNDIGDSAYILEAYDSGKIINSFNDFEVIDMAKNENIRCGASDYFSLDKGIAKYESVYNNLCKG